MTLALAVASQQFVLHVSDRLVTLGREPYDPFANKTIIYEAKDALACISYSGAAFVNGVPTDQWIAGVLAGGPVFPEDGMRVGGSSADWPDIGRAVERLRAACEFHFATPESRKSRREHRLIVLLAGWQEARHGLRPIVCGIKDVGSNAAAFEVKRMGRHWGRGEFRVVAIPPRQIALGALELLRNQVAVCRLSVETTESLVVEAIRRRADAEKPSVVGKDCTAVLLIPPKVRVRFHPAAIQIAEVTGGGSPTELPAAFSPWLVTPGMVCPPSVMIGSSEAHAGGLTIVFEAPEPPPTSSVKFALSSQPRRTFP